MGASLSKHMTTCFKSTSNGNEGEQHEGEQHEGEQHEREQHEVEQHECILLHKEDSPSNNWEITSRCAVRQFHAKCQIVLRIKLDSRI